jgi:hypothetical protein
VLQPRWIARSLIGTLALVLATLVAGCSPPTYLQDAPSDFTFYPAREKIPGALVASNPVKLDLRGRKRALVVAEGPAERLIVNGVPVGKTARVKPGSKIKLVVRAPDGYGETAVGTVRISGVVAEFPVTSLRKKPLAELRLGEAQAKLGRLAMSRVVAPTNFKPGSELKVDAPGIRVETREGEVSPPVALQPGEPFRLVTRVLQGTEEPTEVKVTLGSLTDVWRIRIPEQEVAAKPQP